MHETGNQTKMSYFLGYLRKNHKLPSSCREFQTCNNVELDDDIFFVETKNFLIKGGKVNTKSHYFRESLWSMTKKSTWFEQT